MSPKNWWCLAPYNTTLLAHTYFFALLYSLCWFSRAPCFEMEFVAETSETAENIWIAESDVDIVQLQRFLDKGVPINAQDEYGYSPL